MLVGYNLFINVSIFSLGKKLLVCLLPVHKLEVAAVFNLGSGSRTGVLGMYKHNFNFLIFRPRLRR